MLAALLKSVVASPKVAAFIVCALYGRPDLYNDLADICYRESRCTSHGKHSEHAHARDAWISDREWYGQVYWGNRARKRYGRDTHLNPKCQPRQFPGGWATRGAFGLSAGAHWAYMWPCYSPDLFDVPLVSAWVAVRKYERNCWAKGVATGWCKVRRRSLRDNLRRRGKGVAADYSSAITKVCSPPAPRP